MIGAEFNTETKSICHHTTNGSSMKSLPPHLTDFFELLDPTIARQTAKTLQAVLLEKPSCTTVQCLFPAALFCSRVNGSWVSSLGELC